MTSRRKPEPSRSVATKRPTRSAIPAHWSPRDAAEARLLAAALDARSHAYAPYSGFRVGAAILTSSGRVHAGCNVENASYGATICAERAAVTAMVAAGDARPLACAIVTARPRAAAAEPPAAPCGICRQVLAEFASDLKLLLIGVQDAAPGAPSKPGVAARPARPAKAGAAARDPAPVARAGTAGMIVSETYLSALLPQAFRLGVHPDGNGNANSDGNGDGDGDGNVTATPKNHKK